MLTNGGVEPCQTALVAGGLVRLVTQEIFGPYCTSLPIRLRQLQDRLASVLDSGWIADPPSYSFNLHSEGTLYRNS